MVEIILSALLLVVLHGRFDGIGWESVGLSEIPQGIGAVGDFVGLLGNVVRVCFVMLQALEAVDQRAARVEDNQTRLAILPDLEQFFQRIPALFTVVVRFVEGNAVFHEGICLGTTVFTVSGPKVGGRNGVIDAFIRTGQSKLHSRGLGHDLVGLLILAVDITSSGFVLCYPDAEMAVKAIVHCPVPPPIRFQRERLARVDAVCKLLEVDTRQGVPVAEAVRPPNILGKQIQLVDVVLVDVLVVVNSRRDENIVVGVLRTPEIPVYKQALYPEMAHAAGVTGKVNSFRQSVVTTDDRRQTAKFRFKLSTKSQPSTSASALSASAVHLL